jgi:hypothetical protein
MFCSLTTIKFATDPSSVKLPANVVAIASVSQPISGFSKSGISGFNNITAGKLETRLLKTAELRDKEIIPPLKNSPAYSNR